MEMIVVDLVAIHEAIGGLREDVQALTQGLHALNETIETNGEKLDLLVEAATKEAPTGPSPVHEALLRIVGLLEEQGKVLAEVHSAAVRRGGNGAVHP